MRALGGAAGPSRPGRRTWWHQSARASGPLSVCVNCGASTRQTAAWPPSPMAAKRSPQSLQRTCRAARRLAARACGAALLGERGESALQAAPRCCDCRARCPSGPDVCLRRARP